MTGTTEAKQLREVVSAAQGEIAHRVGSCKVFCSQLDPGGAFWMVCCRLGHVCPLWLFTLPKVTYHEREELTHSVGQHIFRHFRDIQVLASCVWFSCPWELKKMLLIYWLTMGSAAS